MNHLNQQSHHIHHKIVSLVSISDNLGQSEEDLSDTLCLHQLLHLLKFYKQLKKGIVLTHVSYAHDHMIDNYHCYLLNLVTHLIICLLNYLQDDQILYLKECVQDL